MAVVPNVPHYIRIKGLPGSPFIELPTFPLCSARAANFSMYVSHNTSLGAIHKKVKHFKMAHSRQRGSDQRLDRSGVSDFSLSLPLPPS